MDTQFSTHISSSDQSVFSNELANATGPIDYGFTNDYMFRAILQKNIRHPSDHQQQPRRQSGDAGGRRT